MLMTAKPLLTERGEQHGLINVVGNSVQDNDFKYCEPKEKERQIKQKKEDARLVKARYINHQGNHERLTKPYVRYAGDPICTYHLIPGHVYELPMGFINEVNGNPGLANRAEKLDVNGVPSKTDGKPSKVHELVPVSF